MLLAGIILLVGFLAVVLAAEAYGLRFGGVVVVPLLGLYMLFDYKALPVFAASTATAFVCLRVIEGRYILYGRSLMLAAIVAGAFVPTVTALVTQFVFDVGISLRNVAYLGSILPGLAAYNLHRLDEEKRVADIVGSLTLIAGLLLLAAFLYLTRTWAAAPASLGRVVRTAGELLLVSGSPIGTPPSPLLPRFYMVGMFVLGLGLNELIQKRYGLRLAGTIALPLVALYAVFDLRLLWLFIGVTAVCAGFIRLVHRLTFLYGRNLLGGTCVVGIALPLITMPLLPGDVGIRVLVVGILSAVTAYNGHVLAPSDRVHSVVVSTAVFCGMYVLGVILFSIVGRRPSEQLELTTLLIIGVILLTGLWALFEYESLRPEDDIPQITRGETVVPDGGTATTQQVRPDGGDTSPLEGRKVGYVAPNAEVVYWDDIDE